MYFVKKFIKTCSYVPFETMVGMVMNAFFLIILR